MADGYRHLKPWIGKSVEDEVGNAMDFWAEEPEKRAIFVSSQQLEAMFEDDGSNLRIKVYKTVAEHPFVQLVKFTQVDHDEPVEAIVSDSENTIKVRFSRMVLATLESRMNRSITTKTEGGVFLIRKFEIVVPQFSTGDEDPISLLLTDADFRGSAGAALVGQPKPLRTRDKVKTLLGRFHNSKPSDAELDDSAMEVDDDLLSQGEPEPESQAQFGTQVPLTQLHRLSRTNDRDPNSTKHEPSILTKGAETVEPANTGKPLQPKPPNSDLLALLALQKVRYNATNESRVPLQAYQKPMSHATLPPQSQLQTQPVDQNTTFEQKQRAPGTEDTHHGKPTFEGRIENGNDLVISNVHDEHAQNREFKEAQDDGEIEGRPGGARVISKTNAYAEGNTPTSYQLPVKSSSTVPTSNSSIPSIVPAVENDLSEDTPQSPKGPFIHHRRWNCVLPITRSVSRIPEDQADILKSNSILPPPIGQHFPVGNVPSTVLKTLCAQVEDEHRKHNAAPESDRVDETRVDDASISRTSPKVSQLDAMDDELSTPPPPATPDSWASSPVPLANQWPDLPPDSSLPGQQSAGEEDQISRSEDRESPIQQVTMILSSPRTISSRQEQHEDAMDDGSDLEISVPKALPYAMVAEPKLSSYGPASQTDANIGHKGASSLATSTPRHISSSGKPYTHLHLPQSPCPAVNMSSESGRAASTTQPNPSHPRKEQNIPSAPVVPCSYEDPQSAGRALQRVSAFDGAAESKIVSSTDQEDALAEQQIHEEHQSAQRLKLISPSAIRPTQSHSPLVEKNSSGRKSHSAKGSLSHRHSDNLPIKREAYSPSPPSEGRKRAKKFHSNFHFSQDSPLPHMSQNPSQYFRDQRRQFYAQSKAGISLGNLTHRRRASNSSASGLSESASGSSPTSQANAPHDEFAARVKQEPDVGETSILSGAWKQSGSIAKVATSSRENSESSQADTSPRLKAEVLEEDHASIPITETDEVSQSVSHDAMDLDVPVEGQFQMPRVVSALQAATSSWPAKANGYASVVEETNLPTHSVSIQREAPGAPDMIAGMSDNHNLPRAGPSASNSPRSAESRKMVKGKNSTVRVDDSDLSDESSAHSRRARKRSRRVVSSKSSNDMSSDTGSNTNSGNEMRSALASASAHLASSCVTEAVKWNGAQHEGTTGKASADQTMLSSTERRSGALSSQQAPADHASFNQTRGADQTQPAPKDDDKISPPLAKTNPQYDDSYVAEPDDVFSQFTQAYPEYTGNLKHFENLCGQLNWLRTTNRMFHPFLWDDYIVRSRMDFKIYAEQCADEGIDPLPWYKYYVEKISMPKFNKGMMNPSMLEKFFTEQGKTPQPIIRENVSRVGHILKRSLLLSKEHGARRDDDEDDSDNKCAENPKPSSSSKGSGANAVPIGPRQANRQQQQGSPGSSPQSKQPPAPPPVAARSRSAPKTAQQPPLSQFLANAPGRKPPPLTSAQGQGFATKSDTKTSAVAAPRAPRGPAQGRPPSASSSSLSTNQQGRPPSSAPVAKRAAAGPPAQRLPLGMPAPPSSSSAAAEKRLNGTTAPASSSAAAREKRPNGMPGPPPPESSAGGGSGLRKVQRKEKSMFVQFRERYNQPRPGGGGGSGGSSRAGSAV